MKGYNAKRTNKPTEREAKVKVLTVWNGCAWTRVRAKSIDFYIKELGINEEKEINDHRTEYYKNSKCVMIYEYR
jgi:hypothetical protein